MNAFKAGDRISWQSFSTKSGAVYYGTVKHVTPKGMLRILFDEREGCPKDGKPLFERTLAPAWVTKT